MNGKGGNSYLWLRLNKNQIVGKISLEIKSDRSHSFHV